MDTILTQYNSFSETYSNNLAIQDEVANDRFYKALASFDLSGKKLLDVGCGDGSDLLNYQKLGAKAYGIEPSDAFVESAKKQYPGMNIRLGSSEQLPFNHASFDVVVSKYALQTSADVARAMSEISRVVKPGGRVLILVKHPIRQFLEKIDTFAGGVNYFEQKIVSSRIYENKIHLTEPSHTLGEYLSAGVLADLRLESFSEEVDFPASEQLFGHTYPTFFVATFTKVA